MKSDTGNLDLVQKRQCFADNGLMNAERLSYECPLAKNNVDPQYVRSLEDRVLHLETENKQLSQLNAELSQQVQEYMKKNDE